MKLYNAHRLVQLQLLPPRGILASVPKSKRWRYRVTPDVVRFVDESELPENKIPGLIYNPAKYFSHPANVPIEQRQQLWLPDAVITFIRSPHLPPKYASFWVPRWFNKLDMKDYLLRVYGVKVIHVRAFVQLQRIYREQKPARGGEQVKPGALKRPMVKKKMTVELDEPFVWPEEIKDYAPWEKETFQTMDKERRGLMEAQSQEQTKPNKKNAESIAEQAKAILRGQRVWKPTWQMTSLAYRPLESPHPPP